MEFLSICVGIMFVLIGFALFFSSIGLVFLTFPAFEKAYFLYVKVKNNFNDLKSSNN